MKRIFPELCTNLEVTSLAAFIEDDNCVFEQKLDGNRWLIKSDEDRSGRPIILNRNGMPYSKRVPQRILDFRFPTDGDYIVDGEFVIIGRGAAATQTFWAFDLILGDKGLDYTLEVRRGLLENFLRLSGAPFNLVPRAVTKDEKIALAHRALRDGFEGLVIKRQGTPYRSAGRTNDWLKLKFVTTVDVVVTDVRGDGKDSVGYEIYDEHTGAPINIGRASLIGKEKDGAINVGDVIEVRYLYVGSDNRLYQPTILRKRDDKTAAQCTNQQLRYVNKEVLASL